MKHFLLLFILFCSPSLYSNNLQISNVSYDSSTRLLEFTIDWENSWQASNTFDGAYIFAKYSPNGGDNWYHVTLADSIDQNDIWQYISHHDKGIMISPKYSTGFVGPKDIQVLTEPLLGDFQDIRLFGIECVFIGDGEFYVGDGISSGRFFSDGNINVPLHINSDAAIIRGNGTGQFDQDASTNTSDVSEDFPKGYESFYCMKYKVTAKQYVDFLNCLSRGQQNRRTQTDISAASIVNRYVITNTSNVVSRNPIKCDADIGTGPIEFYVDLDDDDIPNEAEDGASLAINGLTAEDMMAYLDWSGLRPMTELEYEKICRGLGVFPIGEEYAWGTDTWNPAGFLINSGTPSESTSEVGLNPSLFSEEPLRTGFAATATSSRTDAGATFFGVMDMHNLNEYMLGVETNLTKWDNGDGNLTILGDANVAAWKLNGQHLSSQDNTNQPNPISKGKTQIPLNQRSYFNGFRGVIILYPSFQ